MSAFDGCELLRLLEEFGETNGGVGSEDQAGVPVTHEVGEVGLLGDDEWDAA